MDGVVLRILDAELNRAREALRVLEDFARFGLNDQPLTLAAKQLRHDLAEAIPREVSPLLILRRDILADVGANVNTASELVRSGPQQAAVASGKRLTEALRSIEEYSKTFDPAFAQRIESLRYRGYELERRIQRHLHAQEQFGAIRLYVLLTEALCHLSWFETAEAVLKGGADCIQLREKGLPDREFLNRARRLSDLCRERGAMFIVNDRPDLAGLSRAHGVHLGRDDMTVADARSVLPESALVGISTHTREQALASAAEAPDYLAVGPMVATPTKPQEHIAGPSTLKAVAQDTSLPLVAIGGINLSNAMEVLSAAPCCLAVCSAVISQPDPEEAARQFRTLIQP